MANKEFFGKSRLQYLYERPLVSPENESKTFPIEHVLKAKLEYFPGKPEPFSFDILEIGPGRGDVFMHLANENPQKKVCAIEIGNLRYTKLCQRITKQNLTNATVIKGDARTLVLRDLPDDRLEKALVLFPDPWPRNCHRHMRLLQKDFVTALLSKIKIGGELIVGTDVKDYADWVLDHLQDSHPEQDFSPRPIELPQTYFEAKWKQGGRESWFIRFVRT